MPPNAIIDLITALWLGFIGACIGSFLNVVAYRMPLGMSIIWKPSHCPKCNHAIRPYDNVPIFGWLWLKGKCRDCNEPISPRYAIVEFVMGLAFFVLAYAELFSGGANLPGGPITEFTGAVNNFLVPHWPLIGVYAYHGVLLSLLMIVVLVDMDEQRTPLSLVLFGVAIGLIAPLVWPHLNPSFLLVDFTPIQVAVVSIILLGELVGCLIASVFWARFFWNDQIHWRNLLYGMQFQWDHREKIFASMLVLACSFLGWRAALILYVSALITGGFWRILRMVSKETPSPQDQASFFTATILLIVFWKQLSELSPW